MKVYLRPGSPVWQVEYRLPGVKGTQRRSTGHRDRRDADVAAHALVERETRKWSRQQDLFASSDSYTWERACADWCAERIHEGVSVATLDLDGQNLKYLSGAEGAGGVRFFGGRLIRDISSKLVLEYIENARAQGLTPETVNKRTSTLRRILASAQSRLGSDNRALLTILPKIPRLAASRDTDGWGRALTREEWESLRGALSTTGEIAGGASPGRGGRKRVSTAVDQRGWCEVALWTAMHVADVNEAFPEYFNIGTEARTVGTHILKPGEFLWRNTKNRRRTSGKVREQVRQMPPQLVTAIRRMALVRDFRPGEPIAGRWPGGNRTRDLHAAAVRAGLTWTKDDRGKPHLVSANDLRRTAATWLAEMLAVRGSGPDKSAVEIIAEFLGHRGLDVARRIYDRAAGARLTVVASMFDEMERLPPKAAPGTPARVLDIARRRKKVG